MSQEFTFTDPGEGLQEAEILEVHVSAGDSVSDGDVVLTVETDKANTDIPAPFDGSIDEVHVSEGDMVEIGDVLLTYSEASAADGQDDDSDETDEQADDSDKDDQNPDESEQGDDADKDEDSADGQQDDSGQDEESDADDDASDDEAESKQKDDKQDDQKRKKRKEKSDKDEDSEQQDKSKSKKEKSDKKQDGDEREPVPAAPSTRRLAREKGVDLHAIEPSGKNGRVTAEDVEAAAEGQSSQDKSPKDDNSKQTETSPLTPGLPPPDLPDFSQWGETEREPLRSIRRATARNMARSWSQIPHVYHQDIADVTALERFRRGHEASQGKLTLTVLVMKALVAVLKEFPRFNASLDVANQEIVYKHYFHIGLAVATERGLLVPVIRDVDRKSVTELAAEAADIANKTRNGELSRADMQGGSITVTNPGPMGGSSLTPLINHPQVAILGMAQARLEPVAEGDLDDYRIAARLRLPLVLGFDHRVNDGADAARFVTALIDTLADPESLLMAV